MILHVRVVATGTSSPTWEVLTDQSKVILTSAPCRSITGAQRAAYRFAKGFPKSKAAGKHQMRIPDDPDRVRVVQ